MRKLFLLLALVVSGVALGADRVARFSGDESAEEWMNKKISYPAAAIDEGISGEVVVSVKIGCTGEVESVRVLKSPSDILTAEVLKIVRLMPRWFPAIKNGRAVSDSVVIPVRFNLSE